MMRIPDLPAVGWTETALALIASKAGRLVKVDELTLTLSKLRFARVDVEVDTAAPLVPGTLLEFEGVSLPPFWQRFEYEHIHLFCNVCGRIRHLKYDCKSPSSPPVSIPATIPSSNQSSSCVDVRNVLTTSADDERPAPCAWILQRRRGFNTKQPPARDSIATSLERAPSRANHALATAHVASSDRIAAPCAHLPAPRATSSRMSRAFVASSSERGQACLVGQPPRGNPLEVSAGFFGPLGLLDTPPSVGDCGLQSNHTQGLLGFAPVVGLPHVCSSNSGMVDLGVSGGAGLTEAPTSTTPTAALASAVYTSRKGKCKKLSSSNGKKKQPGKGKGRAVLCNSDNDTDEDDRCEDYRIMALIELGCNLEDIDRLYCLDAASTTCSNRSIDRPPPSPPRLPPMPAAGFTGLLPSGSLVDSLVQICAEIIGSGDNLPALQSRNVSATIRRIKLLSSLFEEIRDSTSPLPPSSVLCLTEIFSVIRQTKALIEEFAGRSLLWNLVQTEVMARQFNSGTKEMAKALDILPLSLLDIPSDVREQVELLHKQSKRAEPYVDPRELRLRDELFRVMAKEQEDRIGSDIVVGGQMIRGHLDCKKLEEIMWRIGLRSAADYQEELSRLSTELKEQAGTGGLIAISNINNLIAIVSYSKSVILRGGGTGETALAPEQRQPDASMRRALNRSFSWSVSSSPSFNSTVFNIPDEFRCPITLDLMRDPVIVASGHTYDRASIARWINSGHHTCPKSSQKLIHMALIPNYAIKSLIGQWCKENNIPSTFWDTKDTSSTSPAAVSASHVVDHISEVRAATEAVRMTAEFLVGKLAMGSMDIQRQAAYELRLLAKTGMDNRRIIAEAGAIPFLVTLLSSRDPRTQDNAVTALLNLSIFDNNKILIMAAGAIDVIIQVLRSGTTMEARENAAATLFSLSLVDECKVAIGAKPGAIAGLVSLLREGTAVGKRDAATALFNLAVYNANKAAIVSAGAVPVLVDLLMDEKAGITDDVLVVLALLCGCGEGMREIGESRAVVPMLLDLIRFGSPKGKENSISVLLGLCRDGGEEMSRRLLVNPRSVPSLQSLATAGSPRARRKADAVLRLLNRYCSQSTGAAV